MTTEPSARVRKGRTDTGRSRLFSGMLGKEFRHDVRSDRGWVEAALTGSFDRFQTVDRDDEGSSGQRTVRGPARAPEYIEADSPGPWRPDGSGAPTPDPTGGM